MKLFKKNQIIIYVIVLMLMTAGYLNYTSNTEKQTSVETAIQMESGDDMQLADIGDATLVNSNDVETENNNENNGITNSLEEESISKENNTANETITKETSSNNSDDYFVKSKLERDKMYSQMLETYEKVLNSSNSLEIGKQAATEEIQKINTTTKTKTKKQITKNIKKKTKNKR